MEQKKQSFMQALDEFIRLIVKAIYFLYLPAF